MSKMRSEGGREVMVMVTGDELNECVCVLGILRAYLLKNRHRHKYAMCVLSHEDDILYTIYIHIRARAHTTKHKNHHRHTGDVVTNIIVMWTIVYCICIHTAITTLSWDMGHLTLVFSARSLPFSLFSYSFSTHSIPFIHAHAFTQTLICSIHFKKRKTTKYSTQNVEHHFHSMMIGHRHSFAAIICV